MMSETATYISTSNWSGDFYSTGTTGLIVQEEAPEVEERPGISKVEQVKDIFLRAWN